MEYARARVTTLMNSSFESKVPWWTVEMTGYEVGEITKVIESGYINEGSVVERLENELAEKLGVKFAVACTSGTAALFLSLKALGIGPGDYVLVPDMTFIATANAVRLAGAEVVLGDVDSETLTLSMESVRKLWKTKKFKAIIPVHVSGRSAISSELLDFVRENQIVLIEDAAEAFMSVDPKTGKLLGTIGDAGIYSFSPNKLITSGQGGLVVTNSKEISVALRRLKDQGRPERGTGGADLHSYEGYNFKLTNLQAAIALAQIKVLDSRIKHLRTVYQFYRSNIKNCPHIQLLPFDIKAGELPLWPDVLCSNRSKVLSNLEQLGISFREIWLPISTQIPYSNVLVDNQNSISIKDTGFWLPSAFDLRAEDLVRVIEAMNCEDCK